MTIAKLTLAAVLLTMMVGGSIGQKLPPLPPAKEVPPRYPAKQILPEPWRRPIDLTPEVVEAFRKAEILAPPEFDNKPYTGLLKINRTNEAGVRAVCPGIAYAIACAHRLLDGDSCIVTIAYDNILQYHGWDYELALRHELSHCLGWVHKKK